MRMLGWAWLGELCVDAGRHLYCSSITGRVMAIDDRSTSSSDSDCCCFSVQQSNDDQHSPLMDRACVDVFPFAILLHQTTKTSRAFSARVSECSVFRMSVRLSVPRSRMVS